MVGSRLAPLAPQVLPRCNSFPAITDKIMPILPTDPTTGQSQPAGQALGDLFGNVNRPQLTAFVANSQARNGLVSAQTQDAMVKASQAQEQMEAWDKIKTDLIAQGAPESDATLARDAIVGANNHDPVTALKTVAQAKLGYGNPQSQVAGQQMYEGKLAGPVAVPGESVMPVAPPGGSPFGAPQQTPLAAAQTQEQQALAGLNQTKDAAGGFAPHAPPMGAVSPEGQAALTKAVQEGRLDPTRVNSRSAPILAQMELQTPGMNFNRLHADAALQSNATFQQRAMSVDMLPGLLSNVTSLGKKLNGGTGYNDLKSVGVMQQFMNGQTNDPDYTEYMTARNDTLLRLASVMRGVGMSDQAHTAEVQAMAPTLSPAALDAWMKGQMSVVSPLLERQRRITNLGTPGGGTPAPSAATAPAPAAAPPTPSLGDTVPTVQGAGGAPTAPALPTYANEAAALAAGHHKGDRVIIGGQSGTLQ
jgi:hypothetical protein